MMEKDIKAEIRALKSTLKGNLLYDAKVHSDIYQLKKLLIKNKKQKRNE